MNLVTFFAKGDTKGAARLRALLGASRSCEITKRALRLNEVIYTYRFVAPRLTRARIAVNS